MGSDVTVVTVPGAAATAPRVVEAGDPESPPQVVGRVPSVVDLSGARVVAFSDTGPGGGPTVPVPLTDAPVIATDAGIGRLFTVTLAGSRTLGAPVHLVDGMRLTWRIVQDGVGGRTLTLDGIFNVNPAATGAIVLSTVPNKVDYLGGIYRQSVGKIDILAFSRGF